jgi:hypothetical protein
VRTGAALEDGGDLGQGLGLLRLLAQQPDDHRLAVHRGHRRHPGVGLQALELDAAAAVLRLAPLGDVLPERILMREISGPWIALGTTVTSRSSPSMRYRTRTSRSCGSTWMSEAVATAVRTEASLVARRMSSRASTLVGSARATVSTSWARVTGTRRGAGPRCGGAWPGSPRGWAGCPGRGRAGRAGRRGARDLDLVGQAERGDDLPQPPSTARVVALDAQRLVQLRLGEDLPADQHLAEPATPGVPPAAQPCPSRRFSPLLVACRPTSIGRRGAPR